MCAWEQQILVVSEQWAVTVGLEVAGCQVVRSPALIEANCSMCDECLFAQVEANIAFARRVIIANKDVWFCGHHCATMLQQMWGDGIANATEYSQVIYAWWCSMHELMQGHRQEVVVTGTTSGQLVEQICGG